VEQEIEGNTGKPGSSPAHHTKHRRASGLMRFLGFMACIGRSNMTESNLDQPSTEKSPKNSGIDWRDPKYPDYRKDEPTLTEDAEAKQFLDKSSKK
jgi:hypothetical protein